MRPTDEQIRQLMTTVACAMCGSYYQAGGVEVLGHRDELWFLRVNCGSCETSGLVAALVKSADGASQLEEPAPEPAPDPSLDHPRMPGLVTRTDVARMRTFLDSFDGDFKQLFAEPDNQSSRPAA